jgi:hypothetical protein
LDTNWAQSLGECPQIILFSLSKIKVGYDLGQSDSLMGQVAIQLVVFPEALHELYSVNPGTPDFT